MLSHLLELRRRLLQLLVLFAVFFLLFFIFSSSLFHALVLPLLRVLSIDDSLIATQITSPVLMPIQLAANAAMLAIAPFVLFHLWCFTSPGLYRHERMNLRGVMFGSLILFAAGMLFCFYVVLPFMFQFFAHAVPKGVRFMPDITYTLNFITRMLLLFGLCFQVPLICLALVRLQWLDVDTLKQWRPYVIVSAFIIGMVLTPPDVLSQIMLAVPLCILYELGILLAGCFCKRSDLS